MQKLYKKSEVLFSVLLIVVYVIGNSILDQVSDSIGIEMIATIPFDILLLVCMFIFIKRNSLLEYYSLNRVQTDMKKLLYYIPLLIVCTVNVWFGFSVRKVLLRPRFT